MQKTILSKIIAIVLILALTVPIFGNTAYAVAGEVAANQENLRTSTRFVDASLAFVREEEVFDHILADVNEKDLKLKLFLNVKEEGYFQGGQISIRNPENLTYEFVMPDKVSDFIQSVESYTVKLNQIIGSSETYLEIPVRYTGIDNVNSKALFNKNDIEFTGEYVNTSGRKYDVYKRVSLSLNWIDKKEIEITNQIEKFIKHELDGKKEVVVQNLITVKNKAKEIALPTYKISAETDLLKIEDKLPKTVSVAIQKANLFNDEENIILDEEFYSWNKDNNILKIEVENVKNIDDTYSAGSGSLEFLITSYYDIENNFEKYEGDTKLLVKQFVIAGNSRLIEVQKELKTHLILDKEVGKIVDVAESYDITKLPKGILYVNSYATDQKENLVKSKLKLDVSNINIIDSIKIIENEPQYNDKKVERNFVYKTLEINKNEFDTVFGEGYIDIYAGKKLIERIDNKTLEENNKYLFEFKNNYSSIRLETSKPIKEGEVFIELTREFNKSSYGLNDLKSLTSLNINKQAYMVLNNEEKLLNEMNHTIDLVEASSNILVHTNKSDLSTIKKNENVEFVISLNNDKVLSDVYGQTVLEVVLPAGINDVKIKNTNLIHGKGLNIASTNVVKTGSNHLLQIALYGRQDGLSTGHLTNGTNIVINTDITLDKWAKTKDMEYQVRYSNVLATNYANKVEWNMSPKFINFEKYGNGLVVGKIKYSAPEGLVLINEFNNFNKKNDSLISINQGYQEGKLDVLSGKRVVEASLYLLNNSGAQVTTPTILGRIPNKTNKNIFTNESLGSTFDMGLVEKITAENSSAKIYYSSNPNATNDLSNVNNAWNESLNIKNAKSYLITLGNKLAKDEFLKFNYKMELPANLEHNQTIQTYSFAEYGVDTAKGNIRYYQMASPIGLSTGEGVQLALNLKANKEKITEAEDIVYSFEVKNEAKKTNAKNVESYFKIPDNLTFKGVRDDATKSEMSLSKDNKGVYLTLGDINVGETITKDLVFTAKEVKKDEDIELIVNVAADNFEIVKSKKAIGATIESEKLLINIEDSGAEFDPTKINIYPNTTKSYSVVVKNNTGYVYDPNTQTATHGETFGKVNLSLQLPNTLEYIATSSSLYTVTEYNKATNLLKLQLTDNELEPGAVVRFDLSVKLKNSLPPSYNKTINLTMIGTTVTTESKTITVNSNTITNYIAEKKLNTKVLIYNYDEYNVNKKELSSVEEYQDIFVKYSLTPSYLIQNANFIFKVPSGIKVKAIYKDAAYRNQKSALSIGHDTGKANIYKYPFYATANNKIDIFVHAYIEGIGEASSKNLSCEIGMEGATEVINLMVKKGGVQTAVKKMYDKGSLNLSPKDKKKYGIGSSGGVLGTNSILGTTWFDDDKSGIYSSNNKPIGNVVVELVDNDTKKVIARTMSDENGKYQFDNVLNGNYSAVFKYNDNKYTPTIFNAQGDDEDNSKGIQVAVENKGNKNIAVTDGIQVNFASVKNIDLGLIEKSNFDLRLDGEISEVIVEKLNKETKQYNFNDRQNVKIELNRKDLDDTKILAKYKLKITNEGEVEGNVLKLNAYIPEGFSFSQEHNPLWETDQEGNVFTTALSVVNIKPGTVQEISLILSKDFNTQNIGLSTLGVEIAEAKNSLGLLDKDSIPNNKNIEEDDYVSLDLILGLNTGKKIAYTLLMLTILSGIGAIAFLVLRKINGKEIK